MPSSSPCSRRSSWSPRGSAPRRASFGQVVDAWGRGFWDLIPFTLQMALVIITGHVLATAPPMTRVIQAVARWPSSPRGAVALVTLFALISSWFNWGFSLIFSAVLAREVARRVEGVDYRALAAASFLGLGSIWAQGLSGSAALQMATPGALQPQIRDDRRARRSRSRRHHRLPRTRSSCGRASCPCSSRSSSSRPSCGSPRLRRRARAPPAHLGIDLGDDETVAGTGRTAQTPGAWLEHSPLLTWCVVELGGVFLFRYFSTRPSRSTRSR